MAKRTPETARFKPGQSGNRAGRPPGSRHRFGEAFVRALTEDFEKHGVKVIEAVRKDNPEAYMRVCAQVCPQEIIVTPNETDSLSIEQKLARLAQLRSAIERGLGTGLGNRTGSEEDAAPQVPPVH